MLRKRFGAEPQTSTTLMSLTMQGSDHATRPFWTECLTAVSNKLHSRQLAEISWKGEWRVTRLGCLVPLRKGGLWQPSQLASFSLACLTLWLNWLERWLATLSVLSTQVHNRAGLLVLGRYNTIGCFIHYQLSIIAYDCIIDIQLLKTQSHLDVWRERVSTMCENHQHVQKQMCTPVNHPLMCCKHV